MELEQKRLLRFTALLFFLSGATALVYEVLWFRRFAQLWGSTSLAMAAVMAAFLLGLGVGARTIGSLADRMRRPILGFAACEAFIGLWALLVPALLGLLREVYAWLYPALSPWPALYATAQVALSGLVLGPPCVAMGATLPLLVRQIASGPAGLGVPTARLYAVNTAGAAFGCYLAGFHLLPTFGLDGARTIAVVANLAVAAAALPMARGALVAREPAGGPHAPTAVRHSPLVLCAAAAAVGFAALVLQMVWARQLSFLLGGSTYAFTAMLAVVLLGMAAGSVVLPALLRGGRDPLRLLGPLALLFVLAALGGQAALPPLAELAGGLRHLRSSQWMNALACGGTSAVLELIPAFCAGMLFPLIVHLSGGGAARAGHTVGRVYFWNTIGTTAGALLAHALLVPVLGTRASLLLALSLYLFAFALLVGPLPATRRLAARAFAALALLGAIAATPRHDPRIVESGFYVYGEQARRLLTSADVLFHAEGSTANVLVTELGGERSLRINGKVDASTFPADQITQLGSGYLPLFLRPHSREVLVLGYGSGATAGACLQLRDVRVTCVEIEREVFLASPLFAAINHGPELSPDFRMLFEDGRAHVQGTRRIYDVIITEPSNPWLAGVSNLFTREFLLAARERLAPGGLLAQWIQAYALSPDDYRLVLRTVADVFPHVALLRMTVGDSVLVASMEPILPPADDLAELQARVAGSHAVRTDLERYLGTADVRSLLMQYLVLGDAELRALGGDGAEEGLHSDSNMRLEFDAPRRLFDFEDEPGARIDAQVLGAVRARWQRELAVRVGCGEGCAESLHALQGALRARGHDDGALALIAVGLELAPDHPRLLAERLIHGAPAPEALAEGIERVLARSGYEALRVALAAIDAREPERALLVLDQIVAERPESATARAHRARALMQLGRLGEARAELDALIGRDPLNEDVRSAMRLLRALEARAPGAGAGR